MATPQRQQPWDTSQAIWLRTAKGALFVVPVGVFLEGTGLREDGEDLVAQHLEKRGRMSERELAEAECSMQRLAWVPIATAFEDRRVGTFAKQALQQVQKVLPGGSLRG